MTTSEQQTTPTAGTQETMTTSDSSVTDLGSEDNGTQTTAEPAKVADNGTTTDLGSDDDEGAKSGEEKKTEEAKPAFFGVPESGEYADFTLPDGAAADEGLKAEFLPVVKELGLNQEGAQKLVDFKAKLDQRALQNWGDHVKDLRVKAQADPEIGGGNYTPYVAAGKQAINKFGTPEFRAMLNHYGVGNHPEMIRFLAKVGKATGETALPVGGGSGAVVEKKLHELMYKDET